LLVTVFAGFGAVNLYQYSDDKPELRHARLARRDNSLPTTGTGSRMGCAGCRNLPLPATVAFTFLGMAITVVILYPIFIKLEFWVKDVSVKAIKSGKSVAGRFFGLLFTFLAALFVLSYFYAKMWYHIDFFQALIHGRI